MEQAQGLGSKAQSLGFGLVVVVFGFGAANFLLLLGLPDGYS